MVDRIKSLISQMGLSTRAFALKCGLRQNTLSNQLNGLRELSLSTVTSILSACPEVSSEWLLRGVGEMFKTDSSDINADRILKLVDTIATLQDTIAEKNNTIALITERNKQLENKLNMIR